MDNFVTVKKPSSVRHDKDDAKKQERQKFRYNPYGVSSSKERRFEDWKDKKKREKFVHSNYRYKQSIKFDPFRILAPLLKDGQSKPSSSALTKHLLNTLGDKSNPITSSTIYERSDHISSAATGHQRSEGRGPHKSYLDVRAKKLAEQLPEKPTEGAQVLRNVRIYINGYLENTTDIEMKRIVALAGGQVLRTAPGATHILTSQQLSGAKTQKMLTSKSKNIVHVVRPEWVTDSIDAGTRLSEREYSVIKTTHMHKITDMF
ncbi:hypothetical protein C2E23DRAFT_728241 [Lenzites betulinus]|nr:hypothetical protein C2E23DRAFT_728241 [Lenzites betulinus]